MYISYMALKCLRFKITKIYMYKVSKIFLFWEKIFYYNNKKLSFF